MLVSNKDVNFTWWEKSVEYTFIAEMVKHKMFVWAAPLGGNAESALGDLLLNYNGRMRLIEFKRDADSLKSEYKKYSLEEEAEKQEEAYRSAERDLDKCSGKAAHGLVYGEAAEGELKLSATSYWGEVDPRGVIDWIHESGAEQAEFEEYIQRLSILRFSKSEVSEGTGSSGSRSFVVGSGRDGSRFTLELVDYVNLRPALKRRLELGMRKVLKHLPVQETHYAGPSGP